ncbi:hypothetical protein GPECTOR_40g546 [Gonium pectorale]|uniref:EF-hand domain-containing protein n=1 Tax=Gonium pectorale TaxID=33097 RepID=A0A150GAE3_GONPE|nr:hypothetical protein GPECTOR_40g546 [Gonium pectorale]|eukprot:KXZ46812.1 hypothetical protein GPECTOR_40g546 [Gonium pectorale]
MLPYTDITYLWIFVPIPAGQNTQKSMNRVLSVRQVMKTIGANKKSGKKNEKLLEILEELDRDGSGQIDVAELVSLLEGVAKSRKERKYMCLAIVAMFIFGIVLIGAIIGLS